MEEISKGKLMDTKPKAFDENMMITLDMMCSKFVSNSIDKIIQFTCEKIRILKGYKWRHIDILRPPTSIPQPNSLLYKPQTCYLLIKITF